MVVVVTGGTGFLGSHTVARLTREGHQVRIISRSRGHDITRIDSLREAFKGADAVFHLAALVQSRPGPFEQTNVEGLQNVLSLCEQNQVQRVIYVSSFTIFGPSGDRAHTEKTVPERQSFFHAYDRSKYLAYRTVEAWKTRLPINVAFPTIIYGPGPLTEGNLMVRLFQRWKLLRLAPLPGGGLPRWNLVFVEDVADGLIRTLQAPAGEEFVLGENNCSLSELHATFQNVSGLRIAAIGLPDWFFKSSSYLEDRAARAFGFTPLVLPSTADFFLNNWEFSSQKARTQLGYVPRSLRTGLEATYRWMTSGSNPI